MGILGTIRDKVEDAREGIEQKVDRFQTSRQQASEKVAQGRRATAALHYQARSDKIDQQYSSGRISPELAEKQRARADQRRESESRDRVSEYGSRAKNAVKSALVETKNDMFQNMFGAPKKVKKPVPQKTRPQPRERGRPRTYDEPSPRRYSPLGGGFRAPSLQPRKSTKTGGYDPLGDMFGRRKKRMGKRKLPRGWEF